MKQSSTEGRNKYLRYFGMEKTTRAISRKSRNNIQGNQYSTGSKAYTESGIEVDMSTPEWTRNEKKKHGRKNETEHSPTERANSQESTEEAKNTRNTKMGAGEFILDSAPIVIPMRENIGLLYANHIPGPFQSLGKPLDPFATIYQASHASVSVETLKFHCARSFGTRAMGQYWIPTLVKSPHAFLSTLCIASAHLDAINGRTTESVQTLALRQEVMHLISQSLLNPAGRTDDFNVIALFQLIASELIAGQETALAYHEGGIEAMISLRGGLEKLGVNGWVASILTWIMLESALVRGIPPKAMYTKYAAEHSMKKYPNTATIPESPVYCPKGEFETLRRSTNCSPRTMDLLKDMRMMVDLFLHEAKQNRHSCTTLRNIYKKIITQYPSAVEPEKQNTMTPQTWKYEAVRITCVITATAMMHKKPFPDALKHAAELDSKTPLNTTLQHPSISTEHSVSPSRSRHDSPTMSMSTSPIYSTAGSSLYPANLICGSPTAAISTSSFPDTLLASTSNPSYVSKPAAPSATAILLTRLKSVIQFSNLSECWSDMAGVLFWISLTVGAASRNEDKLLRRWFNALAMRVSIVLCFEHAEALHSILGKMGEIAEFVGYDDVERRSGGAENRWTEGIHGAGKRRRV
jgi:hypothetical protein